MVVFFILLVAYLVVNSFVPRVANSGRILMKFGGEIHVSSFAGVLTSISNICVIFMVVLIKRKGFFTSLVVILLNFPVMLRGLILGKQFSILPGFFGNVFILITIVIIYRRNKRIEEYQQTEMEQLMGQQKASFRLFEQTATALVKAVDAKDTYSHGHSIRVAEYSEMIANCLNMDDVQCQRIYYAGLLHDIGKIGVPVAIINKKGKLTNEEFEIIKQHPVMGNEILSSITEYPYLSIGAHYHHERYDGKGYPDKLKGEDIPEIARIIAVADAYDAMSSNRSYRSAMPQQLIREEIVKGTGTQFDPRMAKAMLHLIDLDVDYQMREQAEDGGLSGGNSLVCEENREEVSDGVQITSEMVRVHLKLNGLDEKDGEVHRAGMILFDALDGRYHDEERTIKDLCYFEYAELGLDGTATVKGARKVQVKNSENVGKYSGEYDIYAVKCDDHVWIKIDNGMNPVEETIALPDSARFAFIALTGEQCRISDISVKREDKPVDRDFIPRIVEEISYINSPSGDIPNIQVNGYRYTSSEGIPLNEVLRIRFHTKSLPTARLVWHCPYFVLYSSDDGRIDGKNYREYSLIRLDGENWESEDGSAENRLVTNRLDSFEGWDDWKEKNKAGYEVTALFMRDGQTVTMTTENRGISIRNTTHILDGNGKVYVALTGDQVALTNIRIQTGTEI
ncbi:MAG: HD-GYP domain-containing protein [Lachnospiraceae bacterium]|nr:HD-GYP domain-containing protein [Lachnospiraceae bacterium]